MKILNIDINNIVILLKKISKFYKNLIFYTN